MVHILGMQSCTCPWNCAQHSAGQPHQSLSWCHARHSLMLCHNWVHTSSYCQSYNSLSESSKGIGPLWWVLKKTIGCGLRSLLNGKVCGTCQACQHISKRVFSSNQALNITAYTCWASGRMVHTNTKPWLLPCGVHNEAAVIGKVHVHVCFLDTMKATVMRVFCECAAGKLYVLLSITHANILQLKQISSWFYRKAASYNHVSALFHALVVTAPPSSQNLPLTWKWRGKQQIPCWLRTS